MIDSCMIVGDSIAVGTAAMMPECISWSRGGWNSWQWNRDYLKPASAQRYRTVIVSLGANDHPGVKTEQELRKMRAAIQADRVFWIGLGANRKQDQQAAIIKVASEFGDTVLPRPESQMSSDGIHPTWSGYKTIANQVRTAK